MKSKGFTLIELMIVVAIIGILCAIAIPNFLIFQCKATAEELGFHPKLSYYMCKESNDTCEGDRHRKMACLAALKNGEASLHNFFSPNIVAELKHFGLDNSDNVVPVKPEPNNCDDRIKELETEIRVLKSLISGDLNTVEPKVKPEIDTWKE